MPEAGLTERQEDTMEVLLDIAGDMGQWDQGIGGNGAHYIDAPDNAFAAQGLACRNCVFFQEPDACAIVAGEIASEGVCKWWLIPEALVG